MRQFHVGQVTDAVATDQTDKLVRIRCRNEFVEFIQQQQPTRNKILTKSPLRQKNETTIKENNKIDTRSHTASALLWNSKFSLLYSDSKNEFSSKKEKKMNIFPISQFYAH